MKQTMGDRALNSIYLPYRHVTLKPGKNFRSKIARAFNKWVGMKENKLFDSLLELIEILQNASLMIDDIEDGSELRRGLPCAHIVYGVPSTINSANYYYFLAMQKLTEISPPEKLQKIMQTAIKGILNLHEGQAMDLYFRDNLIVPTEEEYLRTIDLKTGSFFATIARLLNALTDRDVDLENLCRLIGEYFQIRDDYINLCCDDFSKLKGFAEDISEGKLASFPIIYAFHKNPEDSTLLSILKAKMQNDEMKRFVIRYLEENGAFEYTQNKLKQLETEIFLELAKFDENEMVQELITRILVKKP